MSFRTAFPVLSAVHDSRYRHSRRYRKECTGHIRQPPYITGCRLAQSHAGNYYCFSIWIKAEETTVVRFYQDEHLVGEQAVDAGRGWTRHKVSFPVRESGAPEMTLGIATRCRSFCPPCNWSRARRRHLTKRRMACCLTRKITGHGSRKEVLAERSRILCSGWVRTVR